MRRPITLEEEVIRMTNREVPAAVGTPARPRLSRRTTSYHSQFQTTCVPSTDGPPSYRYATTASAKAPQQQGVPHGQDSLPAYSCTVEMEAKMLLNLESISPLHGSCEGEWREVYAIVRGTMISFYKVKDGRAGRLLRVYTLQHAEVGLATDAEHAIYVPMTRFAHLIPASARRRAWKKDPDSFKPVSQTILRLRAETDQLLLADSCEDKVHDLINTIAAAIDISHALDERSIPKQCTVPRRRRRQRAQFNGDVNDPALLAEQERIFTQMYPGFAGARLELQLPEVPSANPVPAREEDEVDLSMIRETVSAGAAANEPSSGPGSTRPNNIRQTTSTTIGSTFSDDMVYATPNTNFNTEGKWSPPHQRSAGQIQRYIKRCMPILLAESPRASDVLIADRRRMRINWRMEVLEEWQLAPPTYKSHEFPTAGNTLTRTLSHHSVPESATQAEQLSSSSILACESEVNQSAELTDALQLAKVVSNNDKLAPQRGEFQLMPEGQKRVANHVQQATVTDIHGVVFCF